MLMPLTNALMSVAPSDSILMQLDIRELTRFGGVLVVRHFRDEHNGTL